MWKKDEEMPAEKKTSEEVREGSSPRRETAPAGPATIGPSITITGDVKGEEDLVIQGRVDGSVDLKNQAVTVGRDGRVKAAIVGRVVTVEGTVEGDLTADEQVILRSAAHVEGDITAPRVVLEDGANFKGLVDMTNPGTGRGRTTQAASASRSSGSSTASTAAKSAEKSESPSKSSSSDDEEGSSSTTSGASGKKEKAST